MDVRQQPVYYAKRQLLPRPKAAGGGQIAGPTYRHQIARDILATNEEARARLEPDLISGEKKLWVERHHGR